MSGAKPDQDGSWELFDHGADIGIRGRGPSRNQAFVQAALALTAVITDPTEVTCKQRVQITDHLTDEDDALLLFDWLNAVIFRMSTEHMVFGRYALKQHGRDLVGWAWGEPVDEEIHDPAVEIKGATMTGLTVYQPEPGTYVAACIVDV